LLLLACSPPRRFLLRGTITFRLHYYSVDDGCDFLSSEDQVISFTALWS
jgi:hypothetical protein